MSRTFRRLKDFNWIKSSVKNYFNFRQRHFFCEMLINAPSVPFNLIEYMIAEIRDKNSRHWKRPTKKDCKSISRAKAKKSIAKMLADKNSSETYSFKSRDYRLSGNPWDYD